MVVRRACLYVVAAMLLLGLVGVIAIIGRISVGSFSVVAGAGNRPASPIAVVISYAYFGALVLAPVTLLGLWFWLHRRNRK